MKTLKLLIVSLMLPLVFHAQQSLTGLWTGSLSNDSVTVRNDQAFEIALTQYKEKVYGYSRSSFIVNDTFYYVLKRVKGTIDGDVCEIKDDEIVSYNFPGKLDKGVRVTITFRRNLQDKDSVWRLSGDWKTNKTKKFYAISGKVEMKSEADFSKSKIFPHLEELKMDKDVEFYTATKKSAEPVKQQKDIASNNKKQESQKNTESIVSKTVISNASTEPNKKAENETTEQALSKHEPANKTEENSEEALVSGPSIKKSDLPASTIPSEQRKDVAVNSLRPEAKKQEVQFKKFETAATNEEQEISKTTTKKSDIATVVKPAEEKRISSETTVSPSIKIPTAAAFVQERKMAGSQVVTFKSDSLELALYDNGEVDGDTVSVLLNGEIFLAKQGLKAAAIKKTIYVQPGTEEVTLVLYAENLGKYPPNTGLLVVHDGEDTYQVRFSADLQQNASVVFRRKK